MIIIIITVVGCLAAYIIYNIAKGYRLVYEGSHPKKNSSLDFNNMPYKGKKFDFSSKDGLKISAIEYISGPEPKGTIIACHYLGGSKTSIYTYIAPLLEDGFNVVSFDYPNHGESQDRKGNKYTLEDDMRKFILKLKELGIKGPYGTFGFSMGATIALSATDFLPEIKATVIDSGPLIYVKDYFTYVLKNKNTKNKIMRIVFLFFYLYIIGFYKMSRRMVKRLKNLKDFPVMIIHSKKDNIISFKNAEYAYNLLNSENAEFIAVERAHHLTNRVMLGELYDNRVKEFFNKWLVTNE